MTNAQQSEALKLVRLLASYNCTEAWGDDQLCAEHTKDRAEMCGPCHAHEFLQKLPKALQGKS